MIGRSILTRLTSARAAGRRATQAAAAASLLLTLAGTAQAQSYDPTFSANTNGAVHAVALQPDGKVLIGGDFTQVNGVARRFLARLNADGSLDTGFTTVITTGLNLRAIALQSDGRIIVGGWFSHVAGSAHTCIVRLNTDGTVDETFTAWVTGLGNQSGIVFELLVEPDDRIVVAGQITAVNGVGRTNIARLNADGTLDGAFAPNVGVLGSLARQSDGKLLIGGGFLSVNGIARTGLARLNANGSLDSAFNPQLTATTVYGIVGGLTVRPDGKIAVGGRFSACNGIARRNLCLLNANGTTDESFTAHVDSLGSFDVGVFELAALPDNRLLVGGTFDRVSGVDTFIVTRLLPTGAVDFTFGTTTGAYGYASVVEIVPQANGNVLIGGEYANLNISRMTSVVATPVNGDLRITGVAAPEPYVAGASLTYTLTLTNIGTDTASSPTGSITVPPGFTITDCSVTCAGSGDTRTFNGIRLTPGQSGTFSLWGTVPAGATGPLTATASIGSLTPDAVTSNNSVAIVSTPTRADLQLTMTAAPNPVTAGSNLTYSLTITNAGPSAASSVVVTDTLPSTVSFVSCLVVGGGGACTGTGNARQITFASIPSGVSRTVTIVASTAAGLDEPVINAASVASATPDPAASNNTATTNITVTPIRADLRLTMTAAPAPLTPGGNLTYSMTVTNLGPNTANSVVVADTLPGTVSFVSCSAVAGACSGTGNARQITFTSIASGVSRTITLVASTAASLAAPVVNTATVTSATADPAASNNAVTIVTGLPGDPDTDGLPSAWETRFGLDPNASTGDNGADGDPDHDGVTNAQERGRGTHPRGFYSSFLPEGARNEFFDARFAVLNVGSAPGRLLFRFLQSDGAVLEHFVDLPQNRRITIDGAILSQLTTPDFSTGLESDQPIVLDRTMTWATGRGSHAETGVPQASTTWYLAEGATAGEFSLFYLLQNPNPAATVATVKYLLPDGLAPITKTYPLPANSRTTIFVDIEDPRLAETDVSGVISTPNGAPIIVERAMYRNTPSQVFAAGHGSSGVTAPATRWFFAEGATGPFFDCFILLANPGTSAARVTINYLLDDGRTFSKEYNVPAEGRYTVYLDGEEIPAGSGIRPLEVVAVSSTVESNVPIIAERSMWWPGPGMGGEVWSEAHNSPGATATSTRWALAEGEVGGPGGAETYVLIANTSATFGAARVTLYFEDGSSEQRTFDLLPRSRRNVNVSADFPSRPTTRFATVVESLPVGGNAAAEIVVERAMYTSPGGAPWEAGTNALASPLPR